MSEAPNRGKVALVVCDGKQGATATQMISFGQPFADAPDSPFLIRFERNHTDAAELQAAFSAHAPDLIILSRCTSPLGQEWIRLARESGLPVIFHIDDDLLAVPESLGPSKYKAYNSPERLKALRDNIESSELLYVSTPGLEKRFREHGIQAPIVAGDVYCAVAEEEIGALIAPATGPVVGYMGTAGHAADVAMIMPAICEVMDLIPSLQFEVFGTIKMPQELERFGTRVRHIPPVPDYAQFLPFLRSLGWWVGLAPLEDNSFNRCKADTKWVEYSLAGMAVVASDLPVYHRACAGDAGILAGSHTQWSEALQRLIYEPAERHKMIRTAQSKLHQAYTHEKLRAQVVQLFDRVLSETRTAEGKGSDPGAVH